ncbi:phosphoribosylanthranilate isomerase [Clostridium oryzae]|uniref:N-(5'-phosphoribosyl)anthranilate isomerase n=1 Tax=Clostridium oryzae TaxID=1450648 RepID=A0A1V4IYN6_9CLOT|nr:phosphoribosylanthranilate isomerase [Clostridium oryzae]OPJ64884.1 N-(5'-phosphoribosyl)anthranilate isomerase [Clostridium oryzae]
MTKVKMCGMRRPEDIDIVNELKPDYIGFILSKSKRQVSVDTAHQLAALADSSIKKVGIFVNRSIDYAAEAALQIPLDIIQLHGDETQTYVNLLRGKLLEHNLSVDIWKAIGIRDKDDIEKIYEYDVDGILLDSKVEVGFGGTGKTFDWRLVKKIEKEKKIILAGGLNKDNVRKAIEVVEPYAVDVSSGIEKDGIKDRELCGNFMKEVEGK